MTSIKRLDNDNAIEFVSCAIGVSSSSQEQDMQVAQGGIDELLKT